MRYPDHPASAGELEREVLERWREEKLFQRTLDATAGRPEFVFYEGPPTANGRPGIHHVISRTIKDLICRHRTMRGLHVTRIAGWDTHGLPVEIEAEKRLGISGKPEIERVGVARFNDVCRESVFTYKEDWEKLSERIGYWLDYSRPYVTFTADYIESIWWILKRLSDRDLLYRGYKSVPYCPRCGTTLSSHEVAQGYEDVSDPSLYFLCPILDHAGEPDGRSFLVWTTTPWTLPANTALALHPGLVYAEAEWPGTEQRLVLAEARVHPVLGDDARVLRRLNAQELEGVRYRPPFELVDVERTARTYTVVLEPFVTAGDGTGIVHIAPAFGADDFAAGRKYGLPMVRPIDDAGRFHASTPLVGGMFVKQADPVLVADLEQRGAVFRSTHEVHTYPHCWRCSSPLLYMARDSWFLRTTAVQDEMVARNRAVDWHPPETGSNRFGEWLEGNIDWAISRERYWGTPLPIWICDEDREHIEVIGSFGALAERAGPLPEGFDPHKPHIDAFTWNCTRCSGTMRRTPEVIDVWFDSGAMPYAQWHYPFENEEQFRSHYPADFICEAIDQTRGWFYSLLAIATMLGDEAPYRAVIVNDLILDAAGQKMSKSKGNVVDPWQAIEVFGADAIRWYLLTVSQPWVPKRFDPEAVGEYARRTFDTLANTYRFFALYARLEGWAPGTGEPDAAARGSLDRWILSRLNGLVASVGADFELYEITRSTRAISDFIVDDLSNWYVRRSRDRFWGSIDEADTRAAFATLHTVLATIARLLAPIVPFHADWLHRALTGETVHLAAFPEAVASDPALERGMAIVRELSRLGRAARERARIRVRQPLRALHALVPDRGALTGDLLTVLKDELNIKEVHLFDRAEELVEHRAIPNFRALGRRFGARTQAAADAVRRLPAEQLAAFVAGGELTIDMDGETFRLEPEELDVREESRGDLVVESDGGITAALDPALDESLRLEGLARELVNRTQRLRKDAGFAVSDRIRLGIWGDPAIQETVRLHGEVIARETLALEIVNGDRADTAGFEHVADVDLDGIAAVIAVARA
ncbi:MAG: isoleucine--tRNA ligase [Gemmatimonadetes bacterium]|nr:isoleucine--tRNA ligase [Gemmatimonadota bacterium]